MKALGAALVLAAAGGVWLRTLAGSAGSWIPFGVLQPSWPGWGPRSRAGRTPLPRLMEELAREEPRLGPGLRQVLSGRGRGRLAGASGPAAPTPGASLPGAGRPCGNWAAPGGDAGESAEALAFARQRVLEELEEKRRSQREQERGSAALCFSGAALVVILLL